MGKRALSHEHIYCGSVSDGPTVRQGHLYSGNAETPTPHGTSKQQKKEIAGWSPLQREYL